MTDKSETEKLWAWCAKTSARLQAIDAMLISLAATQKDNPAFHAALIAVNNSYMATSLNQPAFPDGFIQEYQSHLAGLVPDNAKKLIR